MAKNGSGVVAEAGTIVYLERSKKNYVCLPWKKAGEKTDMRNLPWVNSGGSWLFPELGWNIRDLFW